MNTTALSLTLLAVLCFGVWGFFMKLGQERLGAMPHLMGMGVTTAVVVVIAVASRQFPLPPMRADIMWLPVVATLATLLAMLFSGAGPIEGRGPDGGRGGAFRTVSGHHSGAGGALSGRGVHARQVGRTALRRSGRIPVHPLGERPYTMTSKRGLRIGIDTGGTFTDVVGVRSDTGESLHHQDPDDARRLQRGLDPGDQENSV